MRTATEIGSAPGFDAVFDESFETMKRLAYLLGADDPENIAQEAFVRLHAHWGDLAGPDKASAYVRRIVVNLCRTRLRHLLVVRRVPQDRPVTGASAESQVLTRLEHRSLRAALAGLSQRQRQVLVLRYWLDLELAEIAEILGVAVGTVKATAHQALARLRRIWPDEEAQP